MEVIVLASFTKRGNTWQYSVSRMVDGKYKPIRKGGFRTKKDAVLAAAKIEADITQKELEVDQKGSNISFAQYFLEWYETFKKDVSKKTLNSYSATYNKLVAHFGDMPLQKITKRYYQNFVNDLGEMHSKATNRKMHGYLQTCLREAMDEGLIKVDFSRKAIISGTSAMKSSEKFLDFACSQKLLQYLHENVDNHVSHAMLIVALATGLRYGELVGLCESDIDFEEGRIRVHRQWQYKGDGGFSPLKTEMSERTISVDQRTMDVLNKQIEKVKYDETNEHGLVFYLPSYNASVISNIRLNRHLRSILKKLDIKPSITAHGLRHTHSSILLYKGISILYVSERLGHSNVDITTSTYAHVLKELRERDSVISRDIFQELI